jgi:hypothetical protein
VIETEGLGGAFSLYFGPMTELPHKVKRRRSCPRDAAPGVRFRVCVPCLQPRLVPVETLEMSIRTVEYGDFVGFLLILIAASVASSVRLKTTLADVSVVRIHYNQIAPRDGLEKMGRRLRVSVYHGSVEANFKGSNLPKRQNRGGRMGPAVLLLVAQGFHWIELHGAPGWGVAGIKAYSA